MRLSEPCSLPSQIRVVTEKVAAVFSGGDNGLEFFVGFAFVFCLYGFGVFKLKKKKPIYFDRIEIEREEG